MAIDYGSRSIGVALSDELRMTVRPLTTIRRQHVKHAEIMQRICDLTEQHEIGTLVVGLPLRSDGTSGAAAQRVQSFIAELRRHLTIPIETCGEYLSSREANEILREQGASHHQRRAKSDEYAAAVILQDYLSARSAKMTLTVSDAQENLPPGNFITDDQ
jgi:putative Holliday junction resolvase